MPRKLLRMLNDVSLAVWFMDDGTKGPTGGYTLNTQSFSYRENEYLKEFLERRFSLKMSIHRDKEWWRLYISPATAHRFAALVGAHIIPSMRYKLHAIDPVETTRRLPIKSIGMKI